jgi:hypothetical protein
VLNVARRDLFMLTFRDGFREKTLRIPECEDQKTTARE